MSKLIIESLNAYHKFDGGITYNHADTVTRITHGKTILYIIPYGIDYECEGGHHTEELSEHEFNKRYSLTHILAAWEKQLKGE